MAQTDIWSEMMSLERRFDDLAKELLGARARPYFPALPTGFKRPFIPTADVLRRDGKMVFRLELPGIDPAKDVTVSISDHELVVTGERKHEEEIKEDDYYRMERSFGSFERRFTLPAALDDSEIKAEYANGVLEIELPVPQEPVGTGAKQIPVKVSSNGK